MKFGFDPLPLFLRSKRIISHDFFLWKMSTAAAAVAAMAALAENAMAATSIEWIAPWRQIISHWIGLILNRPTGSHLSHFSSLLIVIGFDMRRHTTHTHTHKKNNSSATTATIINIAFDLWHAIRGTTFLFRAEYGANTRATVAFCFMAYSQN